VQDVVGPVALDHDRLEPRLRFDTVTLHSLLSDSLREDRPTLVEADRLALPRRTVGWWSVVTDPESPYFERADKITSEHELRAGHVYQVRLNDDPRNAQIIEVIREVGNELA
jgi:hypothetical protein